MVAKLVNNPGATRWRMSRNTEGHREYKIRFLVMADSNDGPLTVEQAPGLPQSGATFQYGNDNDPWAFRQEDVVIEPRLDGEPNELWDVEYTFSTKPPEAQRCNAIPIENPLLEPQHISGGFTKYTEQAYYDRFGNLLTNSAHEQFTGPQVEFDNNRPTIRIQQNVLNLGIEVFSRMVDTLNDRPLWGLPRRCIKLSNVSWERKFYGQCFAYFSRTLEFDIRYQTARDPGWDRFIPDKANLMLNGRWSNLTGAFEIEPMPDGSAPNPYNPTHFIRAVRRDGNPGALYLNGQGVPSYVPVVMAGGFGPIITTCCGNNISPRLLGRITNKSAGCSCLPDWFLMTYDPGEPGALTPGWFCRINNCVPGGFEAPPPPGQPQAPAGVDTLGISLFLECPQGAATVGSMVLGGNSNPGGSNPTSGVCRPFSLTFTNYPMDVPAVNLPEGVAPFNQGCTGTADITIMDLTGVTGVGVRYVQKYNESNLLLLGIPMTFGGLI